jgi:hypothetical protein
LWGTRTSAKVSPHTRPLWQTNRKRSLNPALEFEALL